MNGRMWSISAKELRAQLLTVAIVTWGFAVFNASAPGMHYRTGAIKGADFIHFYVLGNLAADGRADLLFDAEAQRKIQTNLVPVSSEYWFIPIYGPQTALLFAGLARLPYLWAALLWALATIVIHVACVGAVWRRSPALLPHMQLMLPAALGFVPLYILAACGQSSVFPLVCLTAGYLAFRSDNKGWAGLALGSLIIKPQFGVAVAVVMLACREWRVIIGGISAIVAQWGLSALLLGTGPMLAYFEMLKQGPALAARLEPEMSLLHSLRAFWLLLLPASPVATVLYVLCSAAVLFATVCLWRTSAPMEYRYSALVLATVLVAPHLGAYDLVLVAPAFVLTASAAETSSGMERSVLRTLLYAAYLALMTGPLTAVTHLQLTVPVFASWLAALCWAVSRQAQKPAPAQLTLA